MCGLAGVIGDLNTSHKEAFRDLMTVASLRGRHSSGVIGVPQRGDYRWAKEVGEPAYLFDTGRYHYAENGMMSALIGHCRHKTSGEINRKNAHPFDYPEEGIIGVHNGTLRNYSHLKGHSYQRVDSDILYEHLAEHGPEATFSNIEGAWACVWYNRETDRYYFIRNDQRTLFFCWTEDSKAMFWASEAWMLNAVKRKLKLHQGDDKDNPKEIHSLPTDQLWSFSVNPNDRNKKITMHTPILIEPKKEVRGQAGNGSAGQTYGKDFTWKRNPATGVSERVPLPNPQNKEVVASGGNHSTEARGGKVVDPFPYGDKLRRMFREQIADLNDPLPGEETPPTGETEGSTAEEKKTTAICAVPFLHSSLIKKDTSTATSDSRTSSRTKLSLPTMSSVALVPQDRSLPCGVSSQPAVNTHSCDEKKKVSLRTISGVSYINDNLKKVEYTEAEFEKNTGAVCMFCHSAIGSLEEVHTFLDKNNFMCVTCVTEPTIPESF